MAYRIRKSTFLTMSLGGLGMYALSRLSLNDRPNGLDRSVDLVLEQLQSTSISSPEHLVTSSEHGMYHFDDSRYALSNLDDSTIAKPSFQHPMVALIANASRAWQHKLASESKTLSQAVAEYKRRYGRPPPRDFDRWWKWAEENDVKLKDEYDFLYSKLEPFFALPPQIFNERNQRVVNGDWGHATVIFVMSIKDGKLTLKNHNNVLGERPANVFHVIEPIASWLPDMDVPIISHDMPSMAVSGPNRERHVAHARNNTLLPLDMINARMHQPGLDSFPNMCSPDSVWRKLIDGVEDIATAARYKPGYISYHDHTAAMDFCEHPDLNQLHGYLAQGHPVMSSYHPVLGFDTAHGYADIPMATFSQYTRPTGDDPDWAQKSSKLAWRGSVTGSSYRFHSKWRSNQRLRLVNRTGPNGTESRTVRWADKNKGDRLQYFRASAADLSNVYYDIELTGKPVQCQKVICDAMVQMYPFSAKRVSPAQLNNFKYQIDVDGNGWSGRFFRLMSTKSAILKSTIIPEWYADRIQPWYHYIPVRLDYYDLDDIMAFFAGDLEGRGAHDGLGEMIGLAGAAWARAFWRPEDMSAYMFRLLLEYARLVHRDPDNLTNMDYRG